MDIEERITEISNKLDIWRAADVRRTTKSKYENLGYICWGFALAVTSLAVTNPRPANIIIAVCFFVLGITTFVYSRKFEAR